MALRAANRWLGVLLGATAGLADATCVGSGRPPPRTDEREAPILVAGGEAALGKAIFFDTNLSDPPGTSCASCHDPKQGFAGNNGSPLGVAAGSRPGHFSKRNTPSVLYMPFVPKFHLHWEEDADRVSAVGGFFWDGRASSIADLVKQPLLDADEMNGQSGARIAAVIAVSSYAGDWKRFVAARAGYETNVLTLIGDAVNAYLESAEMSPFSSRYDDFIRGRGSLTAIEMRGLSLFRDSAKGGCSACHTQSERSADPRASMFSDFEFDALGAPRNRALSTTTTTKDDAAFDLGLCARDGAEYQSNTEEFCGDFRTPSLRNVAIRKYFMHNGVFTKLRDVVAFYATRGTNPGRWYKGREFDDLPPQYRKNVNVDKAPYNRREGDTPALNDDEIDAVVSFLGTLTDAQFLAAP